MTATPPTPADPGRGIGTELVLMRCTECQQLLAIDPATRPASRGDCDLAGLDVRVRHHRLERVTVEGVVVLRGRAGQDGTATRPSDRFRRTDPASETDPAPEGGTRWHGRH